MARWNEIQGGFQKKCQSDGVQWGKGRVESGVIKEDFWDEIGFDTRSCISSPYIAGRTID